MKTLHPVLAGHVTALQLLGSGKRRPIVAAQVKDPDFAFKDVLAALREAVLHDAKDRSRNLVHLFSLHRHLLVFAPEGTLAAKGDAWKGDLLDYKHLKCCLQVTAKGNVRRRFNEAELSALLDELEGASVKD